MKFEFGSKYNPYDATWFKKESRYICVNKILGHDLIYPGFFYLFTKAEISDDDSFSVTLTFREDDLLGNRLVFLGIDKVDKIEPVYSQYFIKVDSKEQEKDLIEQFREVRQKRLENCKRQKWFVEGKKYLYCREICGPGIFVNAMKVGQVYTNEKSYFSEIFLFGYTPEGEPQSVQYDWNNAPDWEAFFKEIKQ